ncbi:MAG: superoxide dismutase family protein [Sphingomonadales bacterium]|nr:superoxide dismutase family protein [Sphingomonadales bacterium]
MRIILLSGAAIALAACAQDRGDYGYDAPPVQAGYASASLTDASGVDRGQVSFTSVDGGVRVSIDARGMTPGVHGAHIHQTGSCIGPDFSSAGGHWNPYAKQHGRDNPAGPHMGDMPNLIVGEGGTGVLELVIEGASISGGPAPLLDEDGSAVVIHAGADDYRSDPAGAAGSRIACGEVVPG